MSPIVIVEVGGSEPPVSGKPRESQPTYLPDGRLWKPVDRDPGIAGHGLRNDQIDEQAEYLVVEIDGPTSTMIAGPLSGAQLLAGAEFDGVEFD